MTLNDYLLRLVVERVAKQSAPQWTVRLIAIDSDGTKLGEWNDGEMIPFLPI